ATPASAATALIEEPWNPRWATNLRSACRTAAARSRPATLTSSACHGLRRAARDLELQTGLSLGDLPETGDRPLHSQPPQDRLAYRRAAVDEERAVELAAARSRIGRGAQLGERAGRGRHARRARERMEEALREATVRLRHAHRLQLGVGEAGMGNQARRRRSRFLEQPVQPEA